MFLYVQTISYSNKNTPIKVLNSMYFGNGMEINMICLIKYSKKKHDAIYVQTFIYSYFEKHLLYWSFLDRPFLVKHFWDDLKFVVSMHIFFHSG